MRLLYQTAVIAVGSIVALSNAPIVYAQTISGFSNFMLNGGATDTITALTLTDNGSNEARSGIYSSQLNYGSGFTAHYTYTASGNKAADGVTFVLENDPAGKNMVGGGGGGLGFYNTSNSAAVEFNIYSANTVGTSFGTDGSIGSTSGQFTASTPVNIASGDAIAVTVTYSSSSNMLMETLLDTSTSASYSMSTTENLSSILGGSGLAYVGFTGATGGAAATQTITNFSYTNMTASEPSTASLLAAFGLVGCILIRRRSVPAQTCIYQPRTHTI